MPELPEVETVVQTLKAQLGHATFTHVDVLWDNIIAQDLEEFKTLIQNQTIQNYGRKGKYLLFELDDYMLIAHLRMEGKFYIQMPEEPINKHIHVIFHLKDGRELRYHDTRKFGRMSIRPKRQDLNYEELANTGPDALDENVTSLELYHKWHQKRIRLKHMLLDQRFLAGIGNIYADEICFSCQLHPATLVTHLSKKDFENICFHTRRILKGAVQAGGTTIRSYTSSLGVHGRFQLELKVHQKVHQPCICCQTPIKKIQLEGRGTYFCPTCQKRK